MSPPNPPLDSESSCCSKFQVRIRVIHVQSCKMDLSSQLFSQKAGKGVSKERSHQSFTEINARKNVQNQTGEL